MAVYLNTKASYELFEMLVHDQYFVDKSGVIEAVSARINTINRYLCITKPRRFGKTSVLNMLGAYYGKGYDSSKLFDGLNVSKSKTYQTHLNQYNVICLCLNYLPDDGSTYEDYIGMVKASIIDDIKEAYPELQDKRFHRISELLTATGDKFIFMIDEWDYLFSHELYTEHHGYFLEFLRNLLKDQPYRGLSCARLRMQHVKAIGLGQEKWMRYYFS